MNLNAGTFLIVFVGLYGLMLLIALVHVVQGLRFGAGTKLIVMSTILFLLGILMVSSATYVVLRPVDWHGTIYLSLPFSQNQDQTQ